MPERSHWTRKRKERKKKRQNGGIHTEAGSYYPECLCEERLTGGVACEKGMWSTLSGPENEWMGRI